MHMASHHHHLPHRQHYPRIKRESRRFVVPLLGLGNLLFLLCCCKLLSVAPFHHPKRYFHYCPSNRELRGVVVVRLARLAYLLMHARRARAVPPCCATPTPAALHPNSIQFFPGTSEHVPHTIRIPIHLSASSRGTTLLATPHMPFRTCCLFSGHRTMHATGPDIGTGNVTWQLCVLILKLKHTHTHTHTHTRVSISCMLYCTGTTVTVRCIKRRD